jgi:long-chain acyl-CoA synthetase
MAWEAMGVRVVQAYGATECMAIVGHDRNSRRPGTVGRPMAGMQVTIAPDGELLARGPNATDGYWKRPEETAAVLAGGWVHTGDAARIDEHGEIVILGRTRDRIALPNGMKVYPEDIEQAVRDASPAVRDAVALEPSPGQLALVVLAASAEVDDAAIDSAVRAANATLALHQRVRRWRRWPEADFPRTHTLKVRRGEVATWFAAQPADEGRDVARQATGMHWTGPGSTEGSP